jgi:hypothetical protein
MMNWEGCGSRHGIFESSATGFSRGTREELKTQPHAKNLTSYLPNICLMLCPHSDTRKIETVISDAAYLASLPCRFVFLSS